MSYSFDYFVGELDCLACGSRSKSDESTNMQTKILLKPQMKPYGVGDMLDFHIAEIEISGYLCIQKPTADKLTLVESWGCPACDTSFNWALITIIDYRIESIATVELSEETIKKANYISEDCGYFGWQIKDGKALLLPF